MAVVNCSVYNLTTSRIVVPWSIHSVMPDLSVEEFYSTKIVCEVQKKCCTNDVVELNFVSLGKSKGTLY